ncbi:MAG: hypothetical protein S0880_17495 [Actinomycetota bacterium]|nr:hypothetical protein [Actinomycetota bacterium]
MTTPGTASATTFDTPITLGGPSRQPRNLLHDQTYDGHASLHDGAVADGLGLAGAPIEAPTHFSQFEPLAFALWGRRWYETGAISGHFRTMVLDGESVTASLTTTVGSEVAEISAVKDSDGSQVLEGTVSVGADTETALDRRLAVINERDPGELFIVDQLEIGMTGDPVTASITADESNGDLYPFSLAEKLGSITERTPWFDSADSPWGRPILPFEMFSVLTNKVPSRFPVRRPHVGLFLDLEARLLDGPLFVDQTYELTREIVGLSQSRKVESYWTRTTITDPDRGAVVATVLLHQGAFKALLRRLPPGQAGLTAPTLTAGAAIPQMVGRGQ